MYIDTFSQMKKMLGQLDTWLDKAEDHAKAKSFDPNHYLGFRLAPDQLPFSAQVMIACDTVKLGASRLTGKAAPSHPDTEKTVEELRTRVRAVREYLDGFTAKDFEGSDERVITNPYWQGQVMRGADYFREHVVPNFYFHVTHTYALLRHNGVNLGKMDYLGQLSFRAP
jgi:uncharacterized protein